MVYLYNAIHKKNNKSTKVIVLSQPQYKILFLFETILLLIKLIVAVGGEDKILFTECLSRRLDQVYMAKVIKFFRPSMQVSCMVHLIPEELEKVFPKQNYRQLLSCMDKVIVLGSSLTRYLVNKGCEGSKIVTLYHYVDRNYYFPKMHVDRIRNNKKRMTCIVMGALGRNFDQLAEIAHSSKMHFIICKGHKKVDHFFRGLDNVELKGYLEEDEFKDLMDKADISLNVMKDTIGSNVICTSMAMGLAMVCSDVGSIRDYCDETNTIFCNTTNDFVDAINLLSVNPERVSKMKKSSVQKSKRLDIDNYYRDLLKALI
jgi:hypothetical protein